MKEIKWIHAQTRPHKTVTTILAKCMDIFEMQDKNIFWNLGEVFETFFLFPFTGILL